MAPSFSLRRALVPAVGLAALLASASACNAVTGLGDLHESPCFPSETCDDAKAPFDAAPVGGDAASEASAAFDAEVRDAEAPLDAEPDVVIITVPPVPGRPGFDLSAGGAVSRSASYMLVGVAGEAPGWNGSSASSSFTLRGGLVGTTQ